MGHGLIRGRLRGGVAVSSVGVRRVKGRSANPCPPIQLPLRPTPSFSVPPIPFCGPSILPHCVSIPPHCPLFPVYLAPPARHPHPPTPTPP